MRLSARFCLAVSRCVLHSRPVSVSWGGSIRPPRGTAEQGDEEYQAVSSAIGGLLVAQSVSRECPDRMLDLRLRGPEYFGNRAYRRAVAPEIGDPLAEPLLVWRSEEHTSELQSLMRISYAVFCLKKKNKQ